MGLWFRLAPVSFVGGSIAPRGGHNPFEPAALGSAILTGPSVENFRPAYDALLRAGGAVSVGDAALLAEVAARLLGDAAARADMTETAAGVLAAAKPDVDALAAEAVALMRERPGA
jgi:3-deoxy-D-manno-octulosonic-acid transferase